LIGLSLCALVCGWTIAPGGVQANPVNYRFTGILDFVDSGITSIDVGDSLSGRFEYDPATTTLVSQDLDFDTYSAPHTLSFDVDGIDPEEVPHGTSAQYGVFVINDGGILTGVLSDEIIFQSQIEIEPGLNLVLSIALADTTATVFSDQSLPSAFNLADFDIALFEISRLSTSFGILLPLLGGDLVALSIPEPSSWVLFSTAALAICVARVRRRRA